MLRNKVQTVGTVSEFTTGTYKFKKVERKVNKNLMKWGVRVAVTVVAGSFMIDVISPMAFAHAALEPSTFREAIPANAMSDQLGSAVTKALQPLIDVLKELAKPIAGVMVTWGCLQYMIGQKEKGIQAIQQAAIGYILVMLSPLILNLITGVGGSLA